MLFEVSFLNQLIYSNFSQTTLNLKTFYAYAYIFCQLSTKKNNSLLAKLMTGSMCAIVSQSKARTRASRLSSLLKHNLGVKVLKLTGKPFHSKASW